MRIEISGGIGSGKTTLATLFSGSKFKVLFENFRLNPFWEPFYQNPNKYNFETEITFVLQHYHQIKLNVDSHVVCDFSLYQDLAFAKLGLTGKRLKIFEDVYSECIAELGPPDYVIRLECDSSTMLQRIKTRGRNEETLIDVQFLETLQQCIVREVDWQKTTPSLTINSGIKNFASNDSDKHEVMESFRELIDFAKL